MCCLKKLCMYCMLRMPTMTMILLFSVPNLLTRLHHHLLWSRRTIVKTLGTYSTVHVPLILVSFYSYSSPCTRTPDVISGRTYVPEEKIYLITRTHGRWLGVEFFWKPHPSVISFLTFLTAAIHPKANISVEGPSIRSSPCTSIRKTKGSGNVSGRKRIKKKTALMVFF